MVRTPPGGSPSHNRLRMEPGCDRTAPSTIVAHQIVGGQEQLAWAGEVDLVDRSLRTGYAAATTCGRLHDNRPEET